MSSAHIPGVGDYGELGWRVIERFGIAEDLDSANVPTDLWTLSDGAQADMVYAAAAATNLISSNDGDKSGGGGIDTVRVEGVDDDFKEIWEEIATNGTTQVNLAKQYQGFGVRCYGTGPARVRNLGNIDVRHSTTVLARIPLLNGEGMGQTQQCGGIVPALDENGAPYASAAVAGWAATSGAQTAGSITIGLDVSTETGPWRVRETMKVHNQGGYVDRRWHFWWEVELKSAVRIRVFDVGNANNLSISGTFDILVRK